MLRIYREGIQSFGTRRRRTRAVVRLGRHQGFYGAELQSFVDAWLMERHNGCSIDVNNALRAGDTDLVKLRKETADYIASTLGRSQPQRVSDNLAPIPLGWTRSIVDRFPSLDGNDLYRVVQFAYDAHALAEHLAWLNKSDSDDVAISRTLWRRLHREYHELRDQCLDAGLIVHSAAPERGSATFWIFPILSSAPGETDQERVPLHEALVRLGVTSRLTVHLAKKVRRLGKKESRTPRWGSGLLAKQAVAQKLKGLRRPDDQAHGTAARPDRLEEEVLLLTGQ
jgi:hypothetical protein